MQTECQESHDPYVQYEETIQEILYRTLNKPDFPLTSKLFALVCFAYEMEPFFYPQTKAFALEKMASIVDKLSNHNYERLWMEEFQDHVFDLELPMSILQSFLLGILKESDEDMQQLLVSSWSLYSRDFENDIFLSVSYLKEKIIVQCSEMAKTYAWKRDRLLDVFSGEIEKYLENYCTHFVFAQSYREKGSLYIYVQELLIQVMLLKFFFTSHSGVMRVVEEAENDNQVDIEKLVQSLDNEVVTVLKTFSNAISKNQSLISRIRHDLQEQNMQSLAHLALFICF